MESLDRLFKQNPFVVIVLAFLVGLLLGWLGIGWGVWPVQWTNAGPVDLADAYRVEWVQMVSESFALTLNVEKAQSRMALLQEQANAVLLQTVQNTEGEDQLRVLQLQQVLGAAGAVQPAANDEAEAAGGNLLSALIPACGVVLLLLVVGGGGIFLLRRRAAAEEDRTPTMVRGEALAEGAAYVDETGATPVAEFMTTYMLGDDLYDDSFSIDDVNGDFLGECGVGISETIGVGDPKKVTAFEVWLFDKNDIRTVTKVLMSENAFADESLKSRLAAKGEPVEAQVGDTLVLETATLSVTARIVDMQYGTGPLPDSSFFQQLTIQLAAWKKADGGA